MTHLVNGCWWCFKWVLALSLAVALAVCLYLYQRVDEEIRCAVEDKFARHYHNLKVDVRGARRIDGEGIQIQGVSIAETHADGPQSELAYFDELLLTCSTRLQDLIQNNLAVTRVVVRRPKIYVTRRADGSWSTTRLFPLPDFGDRTPTIDVQNAIVEVFDPLRNPSGTFTLHDVNLTIAPETVAPAPTSAIPHGELAATSEADAPDKPHRPLKFEGSGTSEHLKLVRFSGTISDGGARWSLDGTIDGLELTPELHNALPGPVAERLAELRSARATARLESFHVASPAQPGEIPQFQVKGQIERGRIDDPRLPYPLTDLRANFRVNNQEIVVEEMVALNGQTVLQVDARRAGLSATSPLEVSARARRLMLTRDLVSTLPDNWRAHWNKFLPDGLIDVDVKLSYDGETWQPEFNATCHGVAFTFHKFPYRLVQTQGNVSFAKGTLSINVTGQGGGQDVHVFGSFANLGPDYTGKLQVWGNNLRIDQQLLSALPVEQRGLVASLRPSGLFDLSSEFRRDPGENQPLHRDISITLKQCAIRYDKFAYPLSNVRGTIVGEDEIWSFTDLEGVNDSGRVTCQGSLRPTTAGPELVLELQGRAVQLEDELREALNLPLQRLWTDLKPHGSIDVNATVHYLTATRQISVGATIWPQPEVCSIEPRFFPYRLDQLGGEIAYRNGEVKLANMHAKHDQVALRADGKCHMLRDGGWQVELSKITADRLVADSELVHALPAPLRSAVYKLDPQGTFFLRGALNLAGTDRRDDPVAAAWNVRLDLRNAQLRCGVPLEHVNGSVQLVGDFDGHTFGSRGELDIDSLTWQKLQFTQLKGPLWLDGERILFGSLAERAAASIMRSSTADVARSGSDTLRQITADVYGGKIVGDGWVTQGNTREFGLTANLHAADLKRVSDEVFAGQERISGRMYGTLNLRGTPAGAHTLRGQGTMELRDADIYELPQMVALLKILSVREPDRTAFTSSQANFRIEGEHVYFDKINFYGDAISLKGSGEVGLDRKLALNFYAVVGRDEFDLPLIGEIIRGASEQMMLVRVDGRLDHPNIRREHFPGVNQALQEIQAGLQSDAPPVAYPTARTLVPRATSVPQQPLPAIPR